MEMRLSCHVTQSMFGLEQVLGYSGSYAVDQHPSIKINPNNQKNSLPSRILIIQSGPNSNNQVGLY